MINIHVISDSVQWLLIFSLVVVVIKLLKRLENEGNQKVSNDSVRLHKDDSGIPIGELFPRKQITVIGDEKIQLYSKNVPTVILYTAINCDACKNLYPHLKEFKNKYPDFELMSIMMGTIEEIEDLKGKYDFEFPIAPSSLDEQLKSETNYFPFGYLISPEGRIVYKGIVFSEEDMQLLTSKYDPNSKNKRASDKNVAS